MGIWLELCKPTESRRSQESMEVYNCRIAHSSMRMMETKLKAGDDILVVYKLTKMQEGRMFRFQGQQIQEFNRLRHVTLRLEMEL